MAGDNFIYKEVMDYVAKQGNLDNAFDLMARMSREVGQGSQGSQFSDYFYGFNRNFQGTPLPSFTEMQGMVFFSRPKLNLSYDNIMGYRPMTVLGSAVENSYQRAVRVMLDPIGALTGANPIKAPGLVDPRMAYMPLLSNACVNIAGWPDIGLSAYTTPEGMAKESWLMADGVAEFNGRFDLTATFDNVKGNPLTLLLHSWIMYIGAIRQGFMEPYMINVMRNVMDYFTRIERYTFDQTGRKIEQWSHTGASFPSNLSIGNYFNYNRDEVYNQDNKQISVTWVSVGAVYNDPIQLREFNMRVVMFNADMADDRRKSRYIQIPFEDRQLTNYNGYPRINEQTMEMEWWIDRDDYKRLIAGNLARSTEIISVTNTNTSSKVGIDA